MMGSYISGAVKIFVRISKSTTNERVYLHFFLHSAILFPSILRNKIVFFFQLRLVIFI